MPDTTLSTETITLFTNASARYSASKATLIKACDNAAEFILDNMPEGTTLYVKDPSVENGYKILHARHSRAGSPAVSRILLLPGSGAINHGACRYLGDGYRDADSETLIAFAAHFRELLETATMLMDTEADEHETATATILQVLADQGK